MLHIHRSHRTEDLVEGLRRVLRDPLPDVAQQDRVMVASAGMVRWVQATLAACDGVVAGVQMLYPSRFIDWIVADLVARDEDVVADPWEREPLTWTIAGLLLEAVRGGAPFNPVRGYLTVDGAVPEVVDRRTLGFAGQTARMFDRYALYRPEMLRAWGDGDDVGASLTPAPLPAEQRWQPALWRMVRDRQPIAGPAERVRAAASALREGTSPSTAVPHRVSVFGMSTLPPLHLELLAALGEHRTVHLFTPSPSPSLWRGGIELDDGRVTAPLLRAAATIGRDAGALVGAACSDDVLAADEVAPSAADDSAARWPAGVLGALQRSVVHDVGLDEVEVEVTPGAPDRSVVFHDCHGPLRQVESLRDELQRRLDDDEDLEPRDIAVLTPDIATFGPLVGSVFASRGLATAVGGHGRDGAPPPIPVTVADRPTSSGNGIAVTLQRCLALATSRASAADVLDLLRTEPVARHLDFTQGAIDSIERWVRDTGVRWGRDPADRAHHDQPARSAHTWAAALDRLLVGVTMADAGSRTYGEVVPYDHVEDVTDLALLERFTEALGVVQSLTTWREPRSPQDWRAACGEVLDALTGPADGVPSMPRAERDAHRRERERVDAVLRRLGRYEQAALALVDVRAVARWVDEELEATAGASGQGTGAVTVADLVPMRAVPYKVVCLLGMDDGTFPRSRVQPAHDLMEEERRAGDPDRRAEDRHLFLEAVLAARDGLVVVYGGRDERTGRPRPPAVPVAELRDAVQGLVGEAGLDERTRQHAVLPISAREFSGGLEAVVSYDAARLAAARRMLGELGTAAPFATDPVQDDGADDEPEQLRRLVRTLQDPARALIDALRIRRIGETRVFPTSEPLELTHLDRAITGRDLLASVTTGTELDQEHRVLLQRGVAPAGVLGERALAPVVRDVAALDRLGSTIGTVAPLAIDLVVGGIRVQGTLPVVLGDEAATVLDVRFVRPRADRELGMWVRHLAATVALEGRRVTTVHGHRARSGAGIAATVAPPVDVEAATEQLGHWLATARRARRQRVDLLPELSKAWAETRRAAVDSAQQAGVELDAAGEASFDELARLDVPDVRKRLETFRRKARSRWDETQFSGRPPLREEAENRVVFRDVDDVEQLVLGEDFQREARALDPMLDALDAGGELARDLVAAAEQGVT